MSVSIINNKNNIRLNFFGSTHIFQKEDLTLQKYDTYILFQDAHQKQKVNYSDISTPTSTSISDLMETLIGYIDSATKEVDEFQAMNTFLLAIKRQTEVNQNIIEELKIQTELLKELNT